MTREDQLKELLKPGETLYQAPCGLGPFIQAGDWLATTPQVAKKGDVVLLISGDRPWGLATVLEDRSHFLLLHNDRNQVVEHPKGRNMLTVTMSAHRF